MKCERCGAPMLEEQVAVSGGLVKLKNPSVWHCTECKRVEYGTMRSLAAAVNTAVQRDMSG
jgi:ribosomal protein L37AE/L43A